MSIRTINSADDTLTTETESDDDIDIVLVNGDQDQSSHVKANSEPESQDTPLKIINEWCDQQGHGDFVQHFDEAIRTKKNCIWVIFRSDSLQSIYVPLCCLIFDMMIKHWCGGYVDSKCSGVDG